MTDRTARLGIPFIAANQAQKHVTFNDAMELIDTLVQLNVESLGEASPPQGAGEGQRYIVGANPSGAWTGHDNAVAIRAQGGWDFISPKRGWLASVANGPALLIFDATQWVPVAQDILGQVSKLGVGATADTVNPVLMRVNTILATARPVSDGGDGDIRLKLNRETLTDTASIVFQTAFAGAAEIGLSGISGVGIKVSDDGSNWKQALHVDTASGKVAFPAGFQGSPFSGNLLINAQFSINQRGTVPGSVAADAYCFDRWKAGAAGAAYARAGGVTTLTTGSMTQIVEPVALSLPNPAGMTLTFSVSGLTGGSLRVTVAGQLGTISVSAPDVPVTITLPSNFSGHIPVKIEPVSTAVSFRSVRLERGTVATSGPLRSFPEDIALCRRYFQKTYAVSTPPGTAALAAPGTVSTSLGLYYAFNGLHDIMQRSPTVTVYNPLSGIAGSWRTGGGTSVIPTIEASDSGIAIYGFGAEAGTLVFGHFTAEAEL